MSEQFGDLEKGRMLGLIEAHDIMVDMSRSISRPRWWELGIRKFHQVSMLCEISQRLAVKIDKLYDARISAISNRAETP